MAETQIKINMVNLWKYSVDADADEVLHRMKRVFRQICVRVCGYACGPLRRHE